MRREKIAIGWNGHFRRFIIPDWLWLTGLFSSFLLFPFYGTIIFINFFRAENPSL